jgi:hypothetical protein
MVCNSFSFDTRYPPVPSSTVPQSAAAVSSSREQASFGAGNWPPLTVEPSDLERFSSQRWTAETKSYFEGGSLAPADLQSEFLLTLKDY